MVEPLRHRQTKGAETDMPGLPPPRHIPTLPTSLSVGYRIGQRTFAAPSPIGCRAPILDPEPLDGLARESVMDNVTFEHERSISPPI